MQLQTIQSKIYEVRGQKIMLDFDLAELYEVETKRLKEAVRRNIERFPSDFMFELTRDEYNSLRTQFATLEDGRGKYSKYSPFAFTEHGVTMLASVLRSQKAIEVNIQIVRAFVFLRQYALSYKELADRLKELEGKFTDVAQAINYLLKKDKQEKDFKKRKRIRFNSNSKNDD